MSAPAVATQRKPWPRAFKLLMISLIGSAIIDLGTHADHNSSVQKFVSSWQTGLEQASVASVWNNFWKGISEESTLQAREALAGGRPLTSSPFIFIEDAFTGVSYAIKHSWDGNWVDKLLVAAYCVILLLVIITVMASKDIRGNPLLTIPIATVVALILSTSLAWLAWAVLSLLLYLLHGFLQFTSLVLTFGLPAAWLWSAVFNTSQQMAREKLAPAAKPASPRPA